MEEDLRNIEWISASERLKPPKKIEPSVDTVVSQIVGQKVYTQDPRLLKLVVKWKKGKSPDSMEPDNFLKDDKKIKELREVFGYKI